MKATNMAIKLTLISGLPTPAVTGSAPVGFGGAVIRVVPAPVPIGLTVVPGAVTYGED